MKERQQRYSEDQDLSDDVSDDHRRASSGGSVIRRSGSVKDLSEILRSKRQGSGGSGQLRTSVSVGGLRSAHVSPSESGVKSRLGASSGDRKRKSPASSDVPSLAKRPLMSVTSNLRQNIIKTVRENEKKSPGSALIKHETFIERKNKTGEAIDWDSKLSRPRMGMVADMKDSRVSAKTRIKGSNNDEDEEVIKRTVPNQRPNIKMRVKNESMFDRNIVMTEVVEEDIEEDVNIVRTVQNDNMEDEMTDDDGFFDDRVVRTRDKISELEIKKQKQRRRINPDDLEYDDGRDLPEWNDKVLIEVSNDDPILPNRPKLEARRPIESKKNKQMARAKAELEEVKMKEKKLEENLRKAAELRKEEEALRKEQEEIDRSRRIEAEKKKAEAEKKKREEVEKKKVADEQKIEELKRKNEELKLEAELKKREETLKMQEEERQIKELQRQEELMKNKLKVLERQKEVEKGKQELEKVKAHKMREIEEKKKEATESRIKAEIKLIEEQENQIRERQKELQKKKSDKKKEIKENI